MNIAIHRSGWLRAALLPCVGVLLLMHPGASLAQSCSANSPALAFGSVDVVAGSTNYGSGTYTNTTTSNVVVTCGVGLLTIGSVKFSACINIAGANGGILRTMSSGSNSLSYNLYTDSARTAVWGTSGSTPGPVVVNLAITSIVLGASASSTVPIYGKLLSTDNTTAIAGSYTGTPTATIGYNSSYSLLGTPADPTPCTSGASNSSAFTLTATATVTNDCAITATTVNFGSSVGILNSNKTATGTITATCTNTDSYSIALNKGTTSGASLTNRLMAGSGSAVVQYQLYTNSGHSTIWGDGSAGTSTNGGTGTGNSQSYTVYGLVQPQPTPAPNAYSDTITVMVTY
jgi:spore coat protein U-like protein